MTIPFRKYLQVSLLTGLAATMPAHAGLLGKWNFEGNLLDSSGNGNHGLLNGTATYVAGADGQGISLNGNVIVSSPAGLPTGGASRSISAWASLASGNANVGDQFLAGYGAMMSSQMFSIQFGLGNGYDYGAWFYECGPDVECDTGVPGQIPLDTFLHLVITYDDPTDIASVYVNGDFYQSDVVVANTGLSDFFIGGYGVANQFTYDGVIDEVGLYDHALSEAEIKQLYRPQHAVPEPMPLLLLGMGLLGLVARRRI